MWIGLAVLVMAWFGIAAYYAPSRTAQAQPIAPSGLSDGLRTYAASGRVAVTTAWTPVLHVRIPDWASGLVYLRVSNQGAAALADLRLTVRGHPEDGPDIWLTGTDWDGDIGLAVPTSGGLATLSPGQNGWVLLNLNPTTEFWVDATASAATYVTITTVVR
jgi:hypothetical protein